MMSLYKFGDFAGGNSTGSVEDLATDHGHGGSVPVASRSTMNQQLHYSTVHKKRPPGLGHTKRSATIHERGVRGVVITSPEHETSNTECPDDRLLHSDASALSLRQINATCHQPVVPQSEPNPRGFTRASESHSAENLLSHAGFAAGGFSSDEGEVGECFICYNAFDEDSPYMTPRNLECGHAFCTGKERGEGGEKERRWRETSSCD